MGKAVSSITSSPGKALGAISGGLSPLGALGSVAGAVGGGLALDPILNKLGIGGGGKQGESFNPAAQQQGIYNAFANDYDNQMGLAEKGLQESALTKDLYGAGGLQSQLASEQNRLSSQGFQLSPEDHEAYGQASGNIARQFGQQEQDLSKSLARRGLGAGSSGAAGAGFSGLAGNKNEMLAQAQTKIANDRMNNTMQRLAQTRSQMQSLGLQGQAQAQDRFNTKAGTLLNAAEVEKGLNASGRQALADKQAAYKPGLLESIGTGLQSGLVSTASKAPGLAVGGLFG